jgi:uncharacterized membrane protein YccC
LIASRESPGAVGPASGVNLVFKTILPVDLMGVRFATNIFIAATILWVILREYQHLNPIWAISSMIAAADPTVEQAKKFFHGRLVNAFIGCGVGLFVLFVGAASDWKIPIALSASVLISTYVARVPVMWRQAPITATIVVAAGLAEHSKMNGIEEGLKRVGEVLLGCAVGLAVTLLMSRVWKEAAAPAGDVVSR